MSDERTAGKGRTDHGTQGRPLVGPGDDGPPSTDNAPAEFADGQGGPPPGDTAEGSRASDPADRVEPLGGSRHSDADRTERAGDDATEGSGG